MCVSGSSFPPRCLLVSIFTLMRLENCCFMFVSWSGCLSSGTSVLILYFLRFHAMSPQQPGFVSLLRRRHLNNIFELIFSGCHRFLDSSSCTTICSVQRPVWQTRTHFCLLHCYNVSTLSLHVSTLSFWLSTQLLQALPCYFVPQTCHFTCPHCHFMFSLVTSCVYLVTIFVHMIINFHISTLSLHASNLSLNLSTLPFCISSLSLHVSTFSLHSSL